MNSVVPATLHIQENVSLQPYNTFGIAARARYFVSVNNEDELRLALTEARQRGLQVLILGGGSNLLFAGDFNGFVIHITFLGIRFEAEAGIEDSVLVTGMAGESWHVLVTHCLQQGWHGLENLALIPGYVGAAPVQNIGAYGVELKDFFVELKALMIDSGECFTLDAQQCRFAYRDSIFKQKLKNRAVILSVTLRLSRKLEVRLDYAALKSALADAPRPITPEAVFNKVCEIRRSKLPDPKVLGNAGSFFKNPVIPAERYAQLLKEFPAMPSFSTGPGSRDVKVPAAWLIERAGWKARRVGAAGVHAQQPLVLVNHGGATGMEILELAGAIRESVMNIFSILLEQEVQAVV